jgi:hypothetical protein
MNDLATLVAKKIGKFIRLLSSERDGEVVAAAHALVRTLEANKLDIHALAKRIENGNGFDEDLARTAFDAGYQAGVRKATAKRPQGNGGTRGGESKPQADSWWNRAARKCWQQSHRLSVKERGFIGQMAKCTYTPSEKQVSWLRGICDRLGVK